MKLIIFGSTGTIGRHLVDQALAQGHEVTAFARNPAKLSAANDDRQADLAPAVIRGDVLDAVAVQRAVSGHDAVLCALGAGRKGGVRARGTKNILITSNLILNLPVGLDLDQVTLQNF